MTSPPSGDEGMHVIPRKVQPRLLRSAVTNPEIQIADDAGRAFSAVGRIAIIGGIIFAVIVSAGLVLYRTHSQKYPVVVTIGVPDKGASGDPLAHALGPLVPVKPEMLRVSSIALGNPRLTIVNGKRVGEGDWLVVQTPLGAASLRIVQIEDGIVRFRHGGDTISAKLQTADKLKR